MKEFSEIQSIVQECGFPGYDFLVTRDGRGEMYLQGQYVEPDTKTGKRMLQKTRRWFLSPEMTRSEIVQTVFKCVITSREHSAREWFSYQGQPVFGPHFDVDSLAELCRKGRFSHREER